MSQDVVTPLHRYESPNGNGLCTYAFGLNTCGKAVSDIVHVSGTVSMIPRPSPVPALEHLEQAGTVYQTFHGFTFPLNDPPTTEQVVAMFHDQALRLAVEKDRAYRRAWVEQGYIGNVGRVLSKAARLRALVWQDDEFQILPGANAETVRDTLLDMANLCAFAAHNLAQGNRWGDNGG